jgi:hypothetical protein
VRPHRGWIVANIASWAACLLFLLGTIFSGILMVVLCPLVAVFAMCTLGITAEEAYADPKCPRCRRVIPAASLEPAARAEPVSLRDVRAA